MTFLHYLVNLLSPQSLQSEACQLKTKMAEIQKDVFQVHKETSACMSNLERLDTMKTKLQVLIHLP